MTPPVPRPVTSQTEYVVRGDGLILREWHERDVPAMVAMFDTAEMDRWTPLAHPFDAEFARSYVRRAGRAKSAGIVQLAITTDGVIPLGEVLLFPTESPEECEFAYAVGSAHRGRHLASRSITQLLPIAKAKGYVQARLVVATDNGASQRVAAQAGFTQVRGPLQRRERKGYVLHMATWKRDLRHVRRSVASSRPGGTLRG